MIAFVGLIWALLMVRPAGGRLRQLGESQVPHEWWVLSTFVVQGLARGRLPWTAEWREVSLALWASVSLGLVVLLFVRGGHFASRLMAWGIGFNLFVVLVNEGMPILGPGAGGPRLGSGFYHYAHQADVFVVLADVLPAPMGYLISIGDVMLMVGMIAFVLQASMRAQGGTLTA